MSSVSVVTVATGQTQHELPTNQRQVGQAFSAQAQSESDRSGRPEETSRGRTRPLQERSRTKIVSRGEEGVLLCEEIQLGHTENKINFGGLVSPRK